MTRRNELYHYGVKGMRWGVRKDRNASGSGGRHQSPNNDEKAVGKKKMSTAKKVAIGAAIVGGTVLVAYGAYKLSEKNYATLKGKEVIDKALANKWQNDASIFNRQSAEFGLLSAKHDKNAREASANVSKLDKVIEEQKASFNPKKMGDVIRQRSWEASDASRSRFEADYNRDKSLEALRNAKKSYARADYYEALSKGYGAKASKTLYGKIQNSRKKQKRSRR